MQPETLNEMLQNVWDLEKRFLLHQFVIFSQLFCLFTDAIVCLAMV